MHTVMVTKQVIYILEMIITHDSCFNQIVAKLVLEHVRLNILHLIWYGILHFCYFNTEFPYIKEVGGLLGCEWYDFENHYLYSRN